MFDTLNRLGSSDECDKQRDGRTDIIIANAALNHGPKRERVSYVKK